ncbi:MAG: hypothetical protein LBQ86_05425 [Holophagales bacterium]|nr:hypothetical protein [Holophagales bacterium]
MLSLALVLLLQTQEPVGPPHPPLYRWKDKNGQVRVTTTTPPPNATILETIFRRDAAEEGPVTLAAPPTREDLRLEMESAMGEETIAYWRNIDRTLHAARLDGNRTKSINTIDSALSETLWGNGLWLLPLTPFVIMAICLLLAWWVCAGLSRPAKVMVWTFFAIVGLISSHIGLNKTLYRPQARRLEYLLSMLPNYLGGYVQMKPENQQAMMDHVETLSKAASPLSPAWAFPTEIRHARQTLYRVVVDP